MEGNFFWGSFPKQKLLKSKIKINKNPQKVFSGQKFKKFISLVMLAGFICFQSYFFGENLVFAQEENSSEIQTTTEEILSPNKEKQKSDVITDEETSENQNNKNESQEVPKDEVKNSKETETVLDETLIEEEIKEQNLSTPETSEQKTDNSASEDLQLKTEQAQEGQFQKNKTAAENLFETQNENNEEIVGESPIDFSEDIASDKAEEKSFPLVINEIQVQTGNNDFVEIYNFSDDLENENNFICNLGKITYSGKTISYLIKNFSYKETALKRFLIWSDIVDGDFFKENNDYYSSENLVSLNNCVFLTCGKEDNKNKQLVDLVCFGDKENDFDKEKIAEELKKEAGSSNITKEIIDNSFFNTKGLKVGQTLARKDGALDPYSQSSFALSSGATPKKPNTFPLPPDPDDGSDESGNSTSNNLLNSGLIINEILPNPNGVDTGNEWIELKNLNSFEINLSGFYFLGGSGKKLVLGNLTIAPNGFLVIPITDSSFYLRNSNETVKLFNAQGNLLSQVYYLESAPDGASFNRDEAGNFSWSKIPTPGAENRINHLPVIKIKKPTEIYLNTYAEFDASDSFDTDGDKLKYRWDFGDGTGSYLAKTRHRFTEKGAYTVSLQLYDGSAKVVETFEIKVVNYPKKKIKIVSLLPNPSGTDTGKETIILANNSGKKVNLKNYKIAIGKDKDSLYFHPVSDNLVIKSKEIFQLKSQKDRVSFTLANGGKVLIQLVYPDGKVADEVEYEKEEIAEEEKYLLTEKGWIWQGGEKVKVSGASSAKPQASAIVLPENSRAENFEALQIFLEETGERCINLDEIQINLWEKENQNWLKFLNY